MQHVTFDVSMVDEDFFADGSMFDGSSIAGWKAINESDMVLMPDVETAHIDPFFQQTTLAIFCDILDPITGEAYSRDPRMTAKKAEAFLPRPASATPSSSARKRNSSCSTTCASTAQYNTGFTPRFRGTAVQLRHRIRGGNLGHRPRTKGGYFPVPPIDLPGHALRNAVGHAKMGLTGKAPPRSGAAQHELGMKFSTLTAMADNLQLYKYVVHNVAHAYGKTATFMPKPVFGDNGSGMHVHQSIWKDGKPRCSPATSMRACPRPACTTSAASSSTPRPSTPSPTRRPTPTSVWCRVLKRRSARLLGAQPFGLDAAFRTCRPPRASASSPLPGSGRQPVPGLRRHADGRPRRHREQDPSGRRDGQGPLRPAGGRAQGHPDRCGSLREALESLDADRDFLKPAASSTTTRSTPTSS
jgi:glutamine synthetase